MSEWIIEERSGAEYNPVRKKYGPYYAKKAVLYTLRSRVENVNNCTVTTWATEASGAHTINITPARRWLEENYLESDAPKEKD